MLYRKARDNKEKTENKIKMIKYLILITIAASISFLTNNTFAESAFFPSKPDLLIKSTLEKPGVIITYINLNLNVSGLDSRPLFLYLSTAGGTSDNAVCMNDSSNNSFAPKVIFGNSSGEPVFIRPTNGKIAIEDIPLTLSTKIVQTNCHNNQSPFVTLATLKDIKLHIGYNANDIGTEILKYNFGDKTIDIATFDIKR
jgi:hypothetical protein